MKTKSQFIPLQIEIFQIGEFQIETHNSLKNVIHTEQIFY